MADTTVCFILSIGSLCIAAMFIETGLAIQIEAAACRIEVGHIHLIGKLMFVKLKSPLNIFFPTVFIISFPADLSFEANSLSTS